MEYQLCSDAMDFMRWLDGKEGEQYWEKDDKGEKTMILRPGWARAQIEYDRIKEIYNKENNGLKVNYYINSIRMLCKVCHEPMEDGMCYDCEWFFKRWS